MHIFIKIYISQILYGLSTVRKETELEISKSHDSVAKNLRIFSWLLFLRWKLPEEHYTLFHSFVGLKYDICGMSIQCDFFLFMICSCVCNWISEVSPDQLDMSLFIRRVSLAFKIYAAGWDWKMTFIESIGITFPIICYDSIFIWPVMH